MSPSRCCCCCCFLNDSAEGSCGGWAPPAPDRLSDAGDQLPASWKLLPSARRQPEAHRLQIRFLRQWHRHYDPKTALQLLLTLLMLLLMLLRL